jgi:hypothetical protein
MKQMGIIDDARMIRAAVDDVYHLWSNDCRYASESRLRAELIRRQLHQHIKGDVCKGCALKMLNAARLFLDRGVILWKL